MVGLLRVVNRLELMATREFLNLKALEMDTNVSVTHVSRDLHYHHFVASLRSDLDLTKTSGSRPNCIRYLQVFPSRTTVRCSVLEAQKLKSMEILARLHKPLTRHVTPTQRAMLASCKHSRTWRLAVNGLRLPWCRN